MKEVEQIGRTVKEATEAALQELGVSQDEVLVEILEEPAKGLFGILGSKQARVRVKIREDAATAARKILSQILKALRLDSTIEVRREAEGGVRLDVWGDDLGVLIGKRGQTLNALQFLLSVMMHKATGQKANIFVDVEGYRVKRERTLQSLAERIARKVKTEQRSVSLEPMLSHERRIIHLALQNHPYVTTYSQGEEPLRKVVISPKNARKEKSPSP